MLEQFTSATFAPLVGTVFTATSIEGESLPLVLVDCVEARSGALGIGGASGGRVPFALTFLGSEDHVLAQQIFTVVHAEVGEFPLFLVPLASDGRGTRYEAVFS